MNLKTAIEVYNNPERFSDEMLIIAVRIVNTWHQENPGKKQDEMPQSSVFSSCSGAEKPV